MVNFHDPAIVAMDNCEYGLIAAEHGECIFFPESYPLEVLARCRWSLYVSLLGTLLLQSIINSISTLSVGNSSRLFTSSGVLSKDVAATVGRSGSVVIAVFREPPASGQ